MGPTTTISDAGRKYLRLNLCPEIGPIRFARLLADLGGIDAVLKASHRELTSVDGIGKGVADSIVRERDKVDVEGEIESARKHGVHILCLADDAYPAPLRHINDPPPCLYVRGTLLKEDGLAMGIVGSRQCSRYGLEQSERFSALLAGAGMTIVSGMARGIDTHAHNGAIIAGGRTLAVLGCGLAHLYPPESGELAMKIANHGAVISALPMDTAPDAKNFPPRNRIIAGLSLGVLVVEAARRSGALITARLASEYNREVFAICGRIDSLTSEGCNDLIKQGGAKLVTCLEDILDELGEAGAMLKSEPGSSTNVSETSSTTLASHAAPPRGLSADEQAVLAAFDGQIMGIEGICEASELPPARVAVAITGLLLKGAVRRGLGDQYERT